jgi:hypothetical protein
MANIFGAGHAAPPQPGGGGAGILPPEFDLPANPAVLTFSSVTGIISLNDSLGVYFNDPDDAGVDNSNYGFPTRTISPVGGISGISATGTGYLVGVFESNAEPTDPAPATIDFISLGKNFASLSPSLDQLFFVGDGLTGDGTGAVQQFNVPSGATRFFLGIADSNAGNPAAAGFYSDNDGSFSASFQISSTSVPEPASLSVLGIGAFGLFKRRRVA